MAADTNRDRIVIVFPTSWDHRQLQACRRSWADRYDVEFMAPSDADCPADFDVIAFIDQQSEQLRGRIAGVLSSSDYPGATVAAAIATNLSLPGSTPATVLSCSHKYYSRIAQREVAPEATAGFELLDPDRLDSAALSLGYPCFVKPVKGAFSVMARRIADADELTTFLGHDEVDEFRNDYLRLFHQLVRRYTDFEYDGRYFLAEQLLRGQLVTVEGFAGPDGVELLGIVDSATDPTTGSFLRFDYPSTLARDVQDRIEDIARRVISRLGLSDSLFNIEMIVDGDSVHIIEVNPRMCGQFADLYEKVDGVNGYRVALDLAAGRRPRLHRGGGSHRAAASVPLRVFEAVHVDRSPTAETIAAVEASEPGLLVWNECHDGQDIDDFLRNEDGHSARYAILNLGGDDRDDITRRTAALQRRLGWRFTPLEETPA